MSGELNPPIILFGNFRSGTTLLHKLISLHPDVVPLYEPVGLWLSADPKRSHDEFEENDATDKVKRYIRNKFLSYQQQHGNRIIVEKTPHNILRIPYVRAIFPEARFLYIVRNPLSFVSSVELKWQNPAFSTRSAERVNSFSISIVAVSRVSPWPLNPLAFPTSESIRMSCFVAALFRLQRRTIIELRGAERRALRVD